MLFGVQRINRFVVLEYNKTNFEIFYSLFTPLFFLISHNYISLQITFCRNLQKNSSFRRVTDIYFLDINLRLHLKNLLATQCNKAKGGTMEKTACYPGRAPPKGLLSAKYTKN